jgi:outer membrane protein assembly factor BamB
MASSTFGRVKGTFALLGVVSIVVIYAIITGWNPLPGWANWVQNVSLTKLASPAPAWSERVGNQPSAATVTPTGIVVATGGSVEVRDPVTGKLLWSRPDSWAGVAGSSAPVVVVGREVGAGFDVYDVTTGVLMWSMHSKSGVWPYADMVLVLKCSSGSHCTLAARNPSTGKTQWSSAINGPGGPLYGFRHSLSTPSVVASAYADPLRAVTTDAPPFLGLPMGDQIHVIKTSNGRVGHVFTSDASTRYVVADREVISANTTERGSQCYYMATGLDPMSGSSDWQKSGIDLRTSSSLGCEQHKSPSGSGDALIATDTSGRDIVISASSGAQLFRAATGERVIAMDPQIAIVKSVDGHSIRAVSLNNGRQLWSQPAVKGMTVGVAPGFVVATDPNVMGKLIVYGRQTGATTLSVTSAATILGIGPNSLIINIGRTIGPLAVTPSP